MFGKPTGERPERRQGEGRTRTVAAHDAAVAAAQEADGGRAAAAKRQVACLRRLELPAIHASRSVDARGPSSLVWGVPR